MKSIFIYIFLIISFQSFGQDSWINLPQENQAEKALDQENYPLAIQLYEKALEIRKAKYPQGFHCNFKALKEVSDAMNNLIIAHSKAGNFTKHLKLCEELSSWSEEGMELFPNKTSPYLDYGLAQIKIAESYQALDQYDKGISVCQNVIDYFLNPGDNRPLKFVANYVIPYAYSRAGKILKHRGNLKASVIQHEKSVATWQNILQQGEEPAVREEIAGQSEICVRRFEALKDTVNVLKYAAIGLENYEVLMNTDPSNESFSKGVENVGNTLAIYKSALGEYEEAIGHYKKSLELNEKKFEQSGSADYLVQLTAVNMKVSECYQSLNNTSKSAQHLSTRIEQLKQLQVLRSSIDYSYSISRNQYNLAKKYEDLAKYVQALAVLDESIVLGTKAIEKDPESIRRKEWQWIQEFFRYQLLMEMDDYEVAYSSLDQLKHIFTGLEALESGIKYSEYIKEVEISQRELTYPDVIKLVAEIKELEDGKMKFDKSSTLVKLLRKKMRKDRSMRLSFVKHTSALAWTGLMTGAFKESKKALKKAMRIKPVDPYLITNYAPCLLFLGKYKKATKVYSRYYDDPFKPGQKIINGFIDDFEEFEEKGIIPNIHREQVEVIKAKLKSWSVETKKE